MIERLLEFEWLLLALRLLFVGAIYLFLYQVLRGGLRELVAVAGGMAGPPVLDLVVTEGGGGFGSGAVVRLADGMTVGRNAGNALRIDDAFVSGEHAQFGMDGGGWWLRDLGSTNGTAVNGRRVRDTVRLRPGDRVQFGGVTMRLVPAPADARG